RPLLQQRSDPAKPGPRSLRAATGRRLPRQGTICRAGRRLPQASAPAASPAPAQGFSLRVLHNAACGHRA
ncbi:MAG: hypothetical protein ABIT82_03510, partial [Ramlibacter sp.]